ncbi:MAG: hypothetical protein OXG47_07665, partial [bacterium]|nr:hypothetical protein [bacterium]
MLEIEDSNNISRRAEFTITIKNVPPEVSVEPLGADTVTEGSPAQFRITMDPAPSAAFNVAIHVMEPGRVRRVSHEDYVGHVAESALGLKKVAIPTSGHLDYPVNTAAQTTLERDTSVVVTVLRPTDTVATEVGGGLGVYVPSPFLKPTLAEVTVSDGPDAASTQTPEVTVRPLSLEVAEGADAVFWLIADPAPATALTVTLTVAGEHGILQSGQAGTRTVTIPAGEPWARGSADLRLRTVKDNAADGTRDRVTVTVNTGSGYTVGDVRTLADGRPPKPPYRLGMRQATVTVVDAGLGAPPAPPVTPTAAPDTPVGNVRITALDAASAKVTWDAVPRASAYLVEWEVRGTQANHAGADFGVLATSVTIAHGAADATSLSVRVVPWYTDAQGQARLLYALAGTATLDLPAPGDTLVRGQSDEVSAGAGQTTAADPAVVKLVEAMIVRHRDVTGNTGALAKWQQALKTLKGQPGGFTMAELEAQIARLSGTPKHRWQRVLDAVKAMQAGSGGGSGGSGTTPATPTITLTPGAAVTEGAAAGFTLTAAPAPTADLAVTVTVEQAGGYVASRNRGKRTVTIAAGAASAGFTVATKSDTKDKPDGAVTATLGAGTGYAVGESATATMPIRDDDATGVTLSAETGDLAEGAGRKLVRLTLGRKLVTGETLAIPLAVGGTARLGTDYTLRSRGARRTGVSHANLASADPAKPPTVTFTGPSAKSATLVLATSADGANEGAGETVTVGLGTLKPTDLGGGAEGAGAVAFTILEPPPEVSIAAKAASITEGADAAFTVSLSRAPGEALTVNLAVSEVDGSDMVASKNEGEATVTIPKGQTEAAFTVPTVNDTQDEPDGTVTLTADGNEGTRYTVAASPKDA